jgi:heme/copper-type cytochrome/quinol oxidase subunit 3
VTETRALPTSLPESVDGLERGRAPGWWGMVLLIVTEALLFSILLVSYVFLRFQLGPDWPAGDIAEPELGLVLVMTPILLSSSAPIHWAERGIRRGKRGRLVAGLLLTIALGATFLSLQAVEYSKTLEEFTPQTNVYGSLFFAITGFHGLHVLVGLLLLAWLVFYAVRGRFTEGRHLPVQVITMYWHFVDVVWVFILLTIYLSPHFT